MKCAAGSALVLVLSTLAACGGKGGPEVSVPPDSTVGLAAFPPMANDNPPGASAAARATATALGRGVNFGNMLEAPSEGAWGLRVEPEYIDAAAAAGFKSVRLPVRWSNHASPGRPFDVDPVFMARLESIVDSLLGKGLYVVLNMHHYHLLDGDPADAGDTAVDSTLVAERFLVMWKQIAEQFKGKSDHLVFELYNEPHGRQSPAAWNDLAARALAVVRKSNPQRVVMIGPTNWNSADALGSLRMPNDSNLIGTIHNYSPFSFTHQGATWVSPVLPVGVSCCDAGQQAELTAPLAKARTWSDATRYPIYLGEFGAFEMGDMASRVRFTRLMRDGAESRGFSWGYWELASGFGVYDPAAHAFRSPLRDALLGN